jgi:hypothetical protein
MENALSFYQERVIMVSKKVTLSMLHILLWLQTVSFPLVGILLKVNVFFREPLVSIYYYPKHFEECYLN